jgi:hypothetical protein
LNAYKESSNERINDLESGEKDSAMTHNKSLTVASGRAE